MGSIIKFSIAALFWLKFQCRAQIEIKIPFNTRISYLSFGMINSNFLAQVLMCPFYPILMINEQMWVIWVMEIYRETTEVIGEHPVPLSLPLPQFPHPFLLDENLVAYLKNAIIFQKIQKDYREYWKLKNRSFSYRISKNVLLKGRETAHKTQNCIKIRVNHHHHHHHHVR